MKIVVVKILQGSVVTQTALGGSTIIYHAAVNFLQCNVPKIMKIGQQ